MGWWSKRNFLLVLMALAVLQLAGEGCTRAPRDPRGAVPLSSSDNVTFPSERWPAYARGFSWGVGSQGETVLIIRQPRTEEVLAVVSRDDFALEGDEWRDFPRIVLGTGGVITTSTTHVALLDAAGGLERWAGCTSLKYLRSDAMLTWVAEHRVADVSGDAGIHVERVMALDPGLVLVSPSHDLPSHHGWPVVPVTEYLEPHPLGRAEWMCALAWMVGDSLQGAQAFGELRRRYEALKQASTDLHASTDPPKQEGRRPTLFTGSVADGIWHAPGADSFVAHWIEDAGGTYALKDLGSFGNVEVGMESLLRLTEQSDAWVMVTYDPDGFTVDDLLAMDPRHEALLQGTGAVWVCNTAFADYFTDVVVHPEWMLEDLMALMSGQTRGPHGLLEVLLSNPKP
ncbi:MAG: ABC transporter substrate-binding protein [Bacteroidetes bacterium]|nr:ABC transporter substrate-binding protein [Bacteroidota bacterium]MDA0902807.1 ABC transporter substrate-binding protein [Bacteroidota bacterium]MDA1242040.1 ABC transporter substrate-binding protein [Bacteroidota bacterium]